MKNGKGRGERGAALVTALMLTTLLLVAGGALIITTSMAATTSSDATAEMQAYYAAEAGLEASLAVMRRNVPATTAGFKATFRNIVCGTALVCTNNSNLSQWLPYNADGLVPLGGNIFYSVTVRDARLAGGGLLPPAPYSPRFLIVTATGRGPKGATKKLEMTVDKLTFTYDAPAALVLRQSSTATSNDHVTIDVGSGGPAYSGIDRFYPTTPPKGAVGVGDASFIRGNEATATTDFKIAQDQFGTVATTPATNNGVVAVGGSNPIPWPDVVSSTANARTFIQAAQVQPDYNGCPPNNYALNGLTFISGNCSLGAGNKGAGLIVITGQLTISGDFGYEGLIFVLGGGSIRRNGNGNEKIYGGLLAANFNLVSGNNFGPVTFNTNGGGGSLVQYDSVAIENALANLGPRVIGVVEK